MGTPEDGPGAHTVHALGNLKDQYFMQHLEQHGVETYEEAIVLVRTLREQDIKTAVVSSSNNCAAVLEAAGIAPLFDARVDGMDITRLALTASRRLMLFWRRRSASRPNRRVPSSWRTRSPASRRGAPAVSAASSALIAAGNRRRCARPAPMCGDQPGAGPGGSGAAFGVVPGVRGFDPAREGMREALCALGMAMSTRGAAIWARADDTHYPGTYFAGGYNRLRTAIAGRVVENEDLVNFPNWLALRFRIADADWFDVRTVTLLSYRQELDLRRGMLLRTIRFEDGQGRRTTLKERRLVSMNDMHLGALELALTAENWSASVTVRTAIDGRVVNGAQLYRPFNNAHLEPLASEVFGEDVYLLVRTCQSHLHVAQAARTRVRQRTAARGPRQVIDEPGYIGQDLVLDLKQGETLVLEKLASFYRDQAISEPGLAARKAVMRAGPSRR